MLIRALLFLTGLTLPFSQARVFAIGPVGFTVNKLITMALLAAGIVVGVLVGRRMPGDRKRGWVAALTAAMGIGLVTSFMRGMPAAGVINHATTLAALVVFYFLLTYVIRDRRTLDSLLWGLIAGVTVTSLSVLLGMGYFEQGGFEAGERSGGLRGDPNGFAYTAVVTVPIVALYLIGRPRPVVKLALSGVLGTILLAIMISFSRTGFVSLLGIGFLWMIRFRRLDLLRFAVPLAVVAGLVVFSATPEWRERMATMTTPEGIASDGSIQSRFRQYQNALEAFVSSPIVGLGYGGFVYFSYFERREATAIHNSYLHVAAEMGLVGLLPYLGLLLFTWLGYAQVWRTAYRHRGRGDPELQKLYLYGIFLQIAFLGSLIGNSFLSSFRYRETWILMAASAVLVELVRNRIGVLADVPAESSQERSGPVALSVPSQEGRTAG